MASLRFSKYQGLGNDFIIVDVKAPDALSVERAKALCDRHFGVGADGVLLVSPSEAGARARMTVINADGSRPEMCGNGLRCVALHLAMQNDEGSSSFRIDTDAGTLGCEVTRDGTRAKVRTELGVARVLDPLEFDDAGESLLFHRVSTGNPHAILFDRKLELASIDDLGPRVSSAIDGGANVEFVRQRGPDWLEVVVWERGVGRTLACGTGAVATVVAAATLGRAHFERAVEVDLPGGRLTIEVSRGLETRLLGPAVHVYDGELPA
jgi:diaminopimelate epimerase